MLGANALVKSTNDLSDRLSAGIKKIAMTLILEINKEIRELGFYDFADMIQFVTAKFQTDNDL